MVLRQEGFTIVIKTMAAAAEDMLCVMMTMMPLMMPLMMPFIWGLLFGMDLLNLQETQVVCH
jgi:hypothetical protein